MVILPILTTSLLEPQFLLSWFMTTARNEFLSIFTVGLINTLCTYLISNWLYFFGRKLDACSGSQHFIDGLGSGLHLKTLGAGLGLQANCERTYRQIAQVVNTGPMFAETDSKTPDAARIDPTIRILTALWKERHIAVLY